MIAPDRPPSLLTLTSPERIGEGFDIHQFDESGDLCLVAAGVEFPEILGLEGHSRPDPIAHAAIKAILEATGLGDMGSVFPANADHAEADSMEMLAELLEHLRENDKPHVTTFKQASFNLFCATEDFNIRDMDPDGLMAGAMSEVLKTRATVTGNSPFLGQTEGLYTKGLVVMRLVPDLENYRDSFN